MIVTFQNLKTGYYIKLLDQEEIYKNYGQKGTLDADDFFSKRVLNLYGHDGLLGLPSNKVSYENVNFSQRNAFRGNRYDIRKVTVITNVFGIIFSNTLTMNEFINRCLYTDNSLIKMSVDISNDKNSGETLFTTYGQFLTDNVGMNGNTLEFICLDCDNGATFEGREQTFQLNLSGETTELKYPEEFPIHFESKQDKRIKNIKNETPFDIYIDFSIVGGIAPGPLKITNTTNSSYIEINAAIADNDKIEIIGEGRRVLKNGTENLIKVSKGNFVKLSPGNNIITFEAPGFDVANPPIAYGRYKARYTSIG